MNKSCLHSAIYVLPAAKKICALLKKFCVHSAIGALLLTNNNWLTEITGTANKQQLAN
jgi:hypothetical protein